MTGRVGGAIGRIFAAGVVTCGLVAAADLDVTRRIAEIRQPEALLEWRRIPWVTDLAEGQRLARRGHRPIFLWASGDDPLERC
jgi:hypothetical protein